MPRFQLPAEVRITTTQVTRPRYDGPPPKPPTEKYKEEYRAQTRELLAKLSAEFPDLTDPAHREAYYEKALQLIAFLTEHGASSMAVEVNAIAQTTLNRVYLGKKNKN